MSWFREKYRHSLAARGISTSKRRSYKIIRGDNFVMSTQKQTLPNVEDSPHYAQEQWIRKLPEGEKKENAWRMFHEATRRGTESDYYEGYGGPYSEFARKHAKSEIEAWAKGAPFYARVYSGRQDKAASVGPFYSLEEYNDFSNKMKELQKRADLEEENWEKHGYEEDYIPKHFVRNSFEDNFFPIKKDELDYPPVDPKLVLSQKNPLDALFGTDNFDDGEYQFSGKTPLWQTHGKVETIEVAPIRGVGPTKFVKVFKNKPWMGEVPEKDDFGNPITDEFVDGESDVGIPGIVSIGGKTMPGPKINAWAIMSPESFRLHGKGLGYGKGQRYKKVGDDFYAIEGSKDHEAYK